MKVSSYQQDRGRANLVNCACFSVAPGVWDSFL
jgi:hypothetical protein